MSREWVERSDEIALLIADPGTSSIPIGGRFLCDIETQEDQMAAFFAARGFSISDAGQCEIFAAKRVPVSEAAIRLSLEELQQLGATTGYRLQSIEAGDPERGTAHVLGAEAGYIPWWHVGG